MTVITLPVSVRKGSSNQGYGKALITYTLPDVDAANKRVPLLLNTIAVGLKLSET